MKRKPFALLGVIFALIAILIITQQETELPESEVPLAGPESESAQITILPESAQDNDFDEAAAFALLSDLANNYEGRMAGTDENKEAVNLIADEFKRLGLEAPFGGYRQGFRAMVPVFGDTFALEVKDSQGATIKSYELRRDYAFGTAYYAGGGDVEAEFREIKRTADADNDLIVLHPEGVRLPHQQRDLLDRGVKAVIAPTANPLRGDRFEYVIKAASIRDPDSKWGDLLILGYVTPDVYEELTGYASQGYRLHVANDLDFDTLLLNNVVGMIPGTDDSLPPLVIAAHLDHVGSDPDGVVFPGALDNASGTSMVVQLARAMAAKEAPPKRTLVFAAFNGEEVGLLGSIDFLKNPPIDPPYEVINFDMVGADPSFPLSMDGTAKNSQLLNELLEAAGDWDIPTDPSTVGEYASDHIPFLQSGYNAFTLIQLDMQRIHTPDDDPSDIHLDQLDRIGEMMEDFLTEYAYE